MAYRCSACNKDVKSVDRIRCPKCDLDYHLECVKYTFISRLPRTRIDPNWLCPECISTKPKNNNNETPVRTITTRNTTTGAINKSPGSLARVASSTTTTLSNSNDITAAIQSFTRDQKTLFEHIERKIDDLKNDFNSKLDTCLAKVDRLTSQFKEVSDRVSQLESSFDFIAKEQDDFRAKATTIDLKIVEYEKRFIHIAKETENIKCQMQGLEERFSEEQQKSRMNNLELFGIPEHRSENLINVICTIAKSLNVVINAADIEFATRVTTRLKDSNFPKPVIVKFIKQDIKNEILSSIRKKKGLTSSEVGFTSKPRPIYINEHLTPLNKLLFKNTRDECKSLGFQYVWTRNGKIYIRKNNNCAAIHIKNMKQIEKLNMVAGKISHE